MQSLFIDIIDSGKTDVDFAYLYRAATNRCLNQLRDAKRRHEILKAESQTAPLGRNRLHDKVVSVDLLTKLLGRLSQREAEILVYHYLDDFTQEQIAELLGIARRTVWSDLQTIRKTATSLAKTALSPETKRGGTI